MQKWTDDTSRDFKSDYALKLCLAAFGISKQGRKPRPLSNLLEIRDLIATVASAIHQLCDAIPKQPVDKPAECNHKSKSETKTRKNTHASRQNHQSTEK